MSLRNPPWLAVFLLILITGRTALGDEPMRAPAPHTFCSNDGQYCATATPAPPPGKTQILRVENAKRVAVWSLAEYVAIGFLSNDGEHIVVANPSNNLIDLNTPETEVMLRFYERERLLRSVTLRELVGPGAKLPRTVSHYAWGEHRGIQPEGHYDVRIHDGRQLLFDVRTGKQLGASGEEASPKPVPAPASQPVQPKPEPKPPTKSGGGCSSP